VRHIEGMITRAWRTPCVRFRLPKPRWRLRDVLGLTVLSPAYVMDGDAIRADMGQLLADRR